MNKKLRDKIMTNQIYDTRNYRYMVRECSDHLEIVRLPIDLLNTTAAIDGWEIVHTVQ